MTGSGEQVELDPQQVANGAAQLDTAAETLQATWRERMAAIEGLHAAAPWGADEAGSTFAGAYADSGALDVGARAGATVDEITTLGTKVRTAAENTLSADELQAAEVTVEVDGL
jgi:hypothetical protein